MNVKGFTEKTEKSLLLILIPGSLSTPRLLPYRSLGLFFMCFATGRSSIQVGMFHFFSMLMAGKACAWTILDCSARAVPSSIMQATTHLQCLQVPLGCVTFQKPCLPLGHPQV